MQGLSAFDHLCIRLYNEICNETNLQSGAILPLLEEAGIEGYEMKSRVMKAFNDIRATKGRIDLEKAKEKAEEFKAKKRGK